MVAGGWGGFKNGQIPLSALTHIYGSFYLRADIAAQLGRMLDDYVAQNPGYARPAIDSAYRDLAEQQWELDHPQGQAIAAVGESTHGWAITADLADTGRNPLTHFSAWLDKNAHLYGLVRTIASESWHYQGGFPATILAGTGGTVINPTQEDDEMKLIQHKDRGIAIIGPGYYKGLTGEELPLALDMFGGPKVYADGPVGAREFDLIKSVATNGVSSPPPGIVTVTPSTPGAATDLSPVLNALAAVPDAVVAAFKDAL
jgi:hypothetical protein